MDKAEECMKSIKEKAEENCIKYGSLGDIACREFEAGANYVLEQFETLLKDKNTGLVEMDELMTLVEQLKSNQ